MRWWLVLTLVGLLHAGCRAPAPTIDPFAPYGARVIPPPPTGSIGSPNGYLQPAPGTIPVAPGGTASGNALQPVPPVATQPAAPRTSSLPNHGQWESAGNGFGYVIPNQPNIAMTSAVAASPLPANAATYASPSYQAAPATVADYVQPGTYMQQGPVMQSGMQVADPLAAHPSSLRPSVVRQPFIESACCPPGVGDTVLVPQAEPYAPAGVPSYMGVPSYAAGSPSPYYGTLTAQTTGWRRRR